jgi:hypothetical protein
MKQSKVMGLTRDNNGLGRGLLIPKSQLKLSAPQILLDVPLGLVLSPSVGFAPLVFMMKIPDWLQHEALKIGITKKWKLMST